MNRAGMTPEERFLQAATRGLSCRKRAEAQAELRSHLHERTQQLILEGKPLPSAQARAMEELGAPGEIARGLRRNEHVHPLLSAGVLMAMAALLLGFPAVDAWRGWKLGVPDRSHYTNVDEAGLRADGFLSLPEARELFQQYGVTLKFFGPWAQLDAPGLPTIHLDGVACSSPGYADPDSGRLFPELRPAHLYLNPGMLPLCLAAAGWPLDLRPDSVAFRGKALPGLPGAAAHMPTLPAPSLRNLYQGALYSPALRGALDGSTVALSGLQATQTYRVDRPAHSPVMLLVRFPEPKGEPVDRSSPPALGRPPALLGNLLTWVATDQTVALPTQLGRNGVGAWEYYGPLKLTRNLEEWRSTPGSVAVGVVIPLSSNPADPIRLSPLDVTPVLQ